MTFDLKNNYHIAVPTAFFPDEELNTEATIDHMLYLQTQGVRSVLVCGSTGEQHSLTLAEKLLLLNALEKETRFDAEFEIIFGVSSIRQKEALQLAEAAEHCSAIAGILLGFAPYILPSQDEAKKYVERIAAVTSKPIILYNNPRRTGFDLGMETLNDLLCLPQIIGLKEAGDYQRTVQLQLPSDKNFYLYAGGEAELAAKVQVGFTRLSSIGGNLFPEEIYDWFTALLAGSTENFSKQAQLDQVFSASPLPYLKNEISKKEQIAMGIARTPLGN